MLHKYLLRLPSFLVQASHHWQSCVHPLLLFRTDMDHPTDVLRLPSFRYLLRLLPLPLLLQPDMLPVYQLLRLREMRLFVMYLIQSHVSYIQSPLQYNLQGKMLFRITAYVQMHLQSQYCCQVHIHKFHLLYGFLLILQQQ